MFTVIPLCWFFFNLIARTSTNNMNNKAETGHPCRIPLFKGNLSESQPLFFMVVYGFLYRIFIHLIN